METVVFLLNELHFSLSFSVFCALSMVLLSHISKEWTENGKEKERIFSGNPFFKNRDFCVLDLQKIVFLVGNPDYLLQK